MKKTILFLLAVATLPSSISCGDKEAKYAVVGLIAVCAIVCAVYNYPYNTPTTSPKHDAPSSDHTQPPLRIIDTKNPVKGFAEELGIENPVKGFAEELGIENPVKGFAEELGIENPVKGFAEELGVENPVKDLLENLSSKDLVKNFTEKISDEDKTNTQNSQPIDPLEINYIYDLFEKYRNAID